MGALWLFWQVATAMAVDATVDRSAVPMGDEVVYTVRVTSARAGAFRVELPRLDGLLMMDRTERLDESRAAGQSSRGYVLEVRSIISNPLSRGSSTRNAPALAEVTRTV